MSLDVYLNAVRPTEVFSANITHNLNEMADKADLYQVLWRPEEIGVTKAEQLVPLLEEGLKKLEADPNYYKTFNPKNGWGSYEYLVNFVHNYLGACQVNPDAIIRVSR